MDFEKLSEDKRQAILNAGILCFGRCGYKKTAISEIAEEAGISKAAIFHYFGSKQDLFLYLYRYAYREVIAQMDEGTTDYFESLTKYIQANIIIINKHPGMNEFLQLQNHKEDFEAIGKLVNIERKHCEKSIAAIFNKVDWEKFQGGYDPNTIMNLATWVWEGCLTQFAEAVPIDESILKVTRYFSILKKALYKPEYL